MDCAFTAVLSGWQIKVRGNDAKVKVLMKFLKGSQRELVKTPSSMFLPGPGGGKHRCVAIVAVLLGLFALGAPAQRPPIPSLAAASAIMSHSENDVVVAKDANSRVRQRQVPVLTNRLGRVTYKTNTVTELATGMHHQVGTNWVLSKEDIQIVKGGGLATNGQHKVGFAANLNVSNAVAVVGPDGKQLKTHILGLSYFDTVSQSNVLVGQLRNSQGYLVRSNILSERHLSLRLGTRTLREYIRNSSDTVVQQLTTHTIWRVPATRIESVRSELAALGALITY